MIFPELLLNSIEFLLNKFKSNCIHTFTELLSNNTDFFRAHIKHSHFQRITTHNGKKFCRVHIKQYRQFKGVNTTYTTHFWRVCIK